MNPRYAGTRCSIFELSIINISYFLICSDRFPYFKAEDERWKNSVRHNLSMNPHFRKGNKAKHGSGHLWVLADIDEDPTVQKVIQEVQAAQAAANAAANG